MFGKQKRSGRLDETKPVEDADEFRFRVLNLVANSPLTISITTSGRVIVSAEFEQADFEARTAPSP